jgi:hypothetical protein
MWEYVPALLVYVRSISLALEVWRFNLLINKIEGLLIVMAARDKTLHDE